MKAFKKTITSISVLLAVIFVFNIPATTRQGINGVLFVRKIPLYVKICGFLYRDYQYKALARLITSSVTDDMERVKIIYQWTVDNIKKTPGDLPVIDDHIWDIIVRRYGSGDQVADVFTTLASYAGYDAFWDSLRVDNVPGALVLSFVKVGKDWYIFDVYDKKSFIGKEKILLPTSCGPTYAEYLKTMDRSKFDVHIRRPDKQKILLRLKYEFEKKFFRKDNSQ